MHHSFFINFLLSMSTLINAFSIHGAENPKEKRAELGKWIGTVQSYGEPLRVIVRDNLLYEATYPSPSFISGVYNQAQSFNILQSIHFLHTDSVLIPTALAITNGCLFASHFLPFYQGITAAPTILNSMHGAFQAINCFYFSTRALYNLIKSCRRRYKENDN